MAVCLALRGVTAGCVPSPPGGLTARVRPGAGSLVVPPRRVEMCTACEAAPGRGSRARESARVRGVVSSRESSEPSGGGRLRPEGVEPSKR